MLSGCIRSIAARFFLAFVLRSPRSISVLSMSMVSIIASMSVVGNSISTEAIAGSWSRSSQASTSLGVIADPRIKSGSGDEEAFWFAGSEKDSWGKEERKEEEDIDLPKLQLNYESRITITAANKKQLLLAIRLVIR